jgi:TonB family protein
MKLPFFVIAAAIACTPQCFAVQPKVETSVHHITDLMVSMPPPEYPLEARRKLIVGRGVYQLIVRPETGVVTRVTVLQSTGSNILDAAAVKAFSRWRARSGRISRMQVPVTFSLVR